MTSILILFPRTDLQLIYCNLKVISSEQVSHYLEFNINFFWK